jgi:hypothetical protein
MKPAALLSLLCSLLFLGSACASLENLSDQQKAVGKAVARIALQLAIGELNGRVKELQPYTPNLVKLLDLTFAKPITPEAAAAQIKAHVAETIPAPRQAEVLATIKDALRRDASSAPPTPAAGPSAADPASYSARLARAL